MQSHTAVIKSRQQRMVINILQLSLVISLLLAVPAIGEDLNLGGLKNTVKPSFTGDFQPHYSTPRGFNLGPYQKELMSSLAENWHPENVNEPDPIIELTVNKDGRLVRAKLYKSSGSRTADKAALYAATVTKFPTYPESYPFEEITLRIDYSRLEIIGGPGDYY